MTFVLRQISQRAGGGEIVRRRELAGDTVRIGRGADCDIRIQDLAVSLHHATLTADGHHRVRVAAAGEQPFGVNGRFTREFLLKVEDEPRLTFGDHLVTVTSDGEDIVLTVTRAAVAAGAPADDGEASGFAAPRRLLGKRNLAWAGFVGIALLSLIVPILAFNGALDGWLHPRIDVDAQWSTGPLSQTHAFLEDDCQSCHQQAFVSVRDDSCMACHSSSQPAAMLQKTNAEVRAGGSPEAPSRITDHAGLQRLVRGTPPPADWGGRIVALARQTFNRPEQRCATCHVEHVGNPLTDPALPKPTLQTTHTCTACHGNLTGRLKDTDLVNTPSWPRHPELRPVITASPGPGEATMRRVSMAANPRETSGLAFPHALHLSATGGVARMAQTLGRGPALDCAGCHTAETAGGNYRPVVMETTCSGCHSLAFATAAGVRQLPHGEPAQVAGFLRNAYAWGGPVTGARSTGSRQRPGAAIQAHRNARNAAGLGAAGAAQRLRGVFSQGGACFDCHTVTGSDAGFGIAPVSVTDAYLSRGAFNHRIEAHRLGPDGQPNCSRCHAASTSDQAGDLLLPKLSECAECHGRQTARQVQAAPADCSTCHSYHAPARPAPRDESKQPVVAAAGAPARRGRRRSQGGVRR